MAALRVKNNDESGLYMFVCVKNRAPRLNSLTSLSSLTELMECMATKRNPSATDQIPRYLRNNCIVIVLEKREQSSHVSIIYVFLCIFSSIYLLAQQTAIYSVSLETA